MRPIVRATDANGVWAGLGWDPNTASALHTVYDVRTYGAVPDDANEDSTAIQAAYDAAYAAGGGTVHLCNGNLKLAAPIVLNTATSGANTQIAIIIEGESAGRPQANGTRLDISALSAGQAAFTHSAAAYIYNHTFRDFSIAGNGSGATVGAADGFDLAWISNFHFEHLELRYCKAAFLIGTQTLGCRWANCVINYNGRGVVLDNNATVSVCEWNFCQFLGNSEPNAAFEAETSTLTTNLHANTIYKCWFEFNLYSGVRIGDSKNVAGLNISDCYFELNGSLGGQYDIRIEPTTTSFVLSNSVFANNLVAANLLLRVPYSATVTDCTMGYSGQARSIDLGYPGAGSVYNVDVLGGTLYGDANGTAIHYLGTGTPNVRVKGVKWQRDPDIAMDFTPSAAEFCYDGNTPGLAIGLKQPQYPLDVNGNVNITGDYLVNGAVPVWTDPCFTNGFILHAGRSAARTTPANDTAIYMTTDSGAAYPFLENGNLVYQSRIGSERDHVFLNGNGERLAVVRRTGRFDVNEVNVVSAVTPIIKPASDSTTAVRVTAANGTTQVLCVDTTNSRAIVGTGTSTADLAVKPDTDATVYLGRSAVGSPTSDYATFSHYDSLSTTGYGVAATSTGATLINSASTQSIFFTRAGSIIGRWYYNMLAIGTQLPTQSVDIFGGSAVVRDFATLGSESLTNPNLTSGTSWSTTGSFSLASNAATASGAGTLVQASGTLAVAGAANRWYKFTYTISATSGSPAATITTGFASAATSLTLTAGAQTTYFKSAASPGDFTISATAGTFTIDTLSLKYADGGDGQFMGLVTGGGTQGLKVGGNGDVTLGNRANLPVTGTSGHTLTFAENGGEPTMPADTAGIYATDIGGTMEMYAVDEAGNETLLTNDYEGQADTSSFKDPNGNVPVAIIKRNAYIGIEQRVDMLKLAYAMEKLTGEKFVTVKQIPQRDWNAEQARRKAENEKAIASALARRAELNKQIDESFAAYRTEPNAIKASAILEVWAEMVSERADLVVPDEYRIEPEPAWMIKAKGKK